MTYTPKRDYRFEYVGDVITFIEEYQCKGCAFMNDRGDGMFMCPEIEGELILEKSVPDLDDRGEHGVVCTRYRSVDDYTHPDPLQMELF